MDLLVRGRDVHQRKASSMSDPTQLKEFASTDFLQNVL